MPSGQIVMWAALALCVVRLLRYATLGRLYQRRNEVPPVSFARNVVGVAVISCALCVFLIGTSRPFALTGAIAAFALLAFEIVRSVRAP